MSLRSTARVQTCCASRSSASSAPLTFASVAKSVCLPSKKRCRGVNTSGHLEPRGSVATPLAGSDHDQASVLRLETTNECGQKDQEDDEGNSGWCIAIKGGPHELDHDAEPESSSTDS